MLWHIVVTKLIPEAIHEHVTVALEDLYCAFKGFDNHVDGENRYLAITTSFHVF